MATITALEVQKRSQDRVSVYLDGEFAFGLPIDEAARLHTGQVLLDAEITALRAIDAVARTFDRAVKLLARRPYSTTELRRHLETKEIAPAVIDEALDRLARLGYVDDRAFALYWVENRERFRPRGPRALQYELRQKGVADAIIAEVLAELDPFDSAYQAAQEKVRRLQGTDQAHFRNTVGAFLVRRGFGYDIVREVIDQIVAELEEENSDYFIPNEE